MDGQTANLSVNAKELIRVHLSNNQDAVRVLQDRVRIAEEELELQARRRTELEKMLIKRQSAYEELLDKTASNQSMAVEDIKASYSVFSPSKNKLTIRSSSNNVSTTRKRGSRATWQSNSSSTTRRTPKSND